MKAFDEEKIRESIQMQQNLFEQAAKTSQYFANFTVFEDEEEEQYQAGGAGAPWGQEYQCT